MSLLSDLPPFGVFSINGGIRFSVSSLLERLLCSILCLTILFSVSLLILWDFREKPDAEDNDDSEDKEEVSLVGEIKLEGASCVTFISTELDLEPAEVLPSMRAPFNPSDRCLSMLSWGSNNPIDGDFEDLLKLVGQIRSDGEAFTLDLLPSLSLLLSYNVETLRILSLC